MKRSTPPRMAIAMILTLWFGGTHACSVRGDMPTPQSLVEQADGIYLVQATTYSPHPAAEPYNSISTQIQFVVRETLKGPRQATLEFMGKFEDKDDYDNTRKIPHTWVRPNGTKGDCFANAYKQGAQYLLLIRNGSPYWKPLMPLNDQVTGPDDPWVQWVRAAVTRR